jgi:hypothetical protein
MQFRENPQLGPPPPSPPSECVPVLPLIQKGGDTLACGWGGGGVAIRTTGDKSLALLSLLWKNSLFIPVLRIRIHRIHMFLGLQDPDPLVRGMDPDPSIIKQK